MKNFYFKFSLLLMLLLPLSAAAQNLWGFGHFEFYQDYNYDAYALTGGKIHIKLPIYATGRETDGSAGNPTPGQWTQTYCQYITSNGHTPIIFYDGRDTRNHIAPSELSHAFNIPAYAHIRVYSGQVVVTNIYENETNVFEADHEEHEVKLYRENNNSCVYLEFDWYPPSINGVFTISGKVESYSYNGSGFNRPIGEDYHFNLGNNFRYDGDPHPQLMDPIFYPVNNNGNSTPGYIGVPYMSFQEVYSYHTAWDNTERPCNEQSDVLLVRAADSLQHGFYITMVTKDSRSTNGNLIKQTLNSNKVNIPAYHKIHDFTVKPYTWKYEQRWYTDTRFNRLSWKIYLPREKEIMPNDMFELQRAYNSDFSDAQTIETFSMVWDSVNTLEYITHNSSEYITYTYVDSNVIGNNTPRTSDSVYYRVRRASSAIWGWDGHNYAAQCSAELEKRLIGLRNSECVYRKDPDFNNNHKVNLTIAFYDDNYFYDGDSLYPRERNAYWDPNATLYIKKVLVESGDTILIRIPDEDIIHSMESHFYTQDYDFYRWDKFTINYTDVLNTPCTHVNYFFYIDTAGAFLHQDWRTLWNWGDVTQTWPFIHSPYYEEEPYFTDAANLNSLTATDGEYPDRVLLTWDLTEGGANNFTVETSPNSSSSWTVLGTTTEAYWNDLLADPSVSPEWQYRVTMSYTCNGNTVTDRRYTTGSRSPWGRVSGRVHYEDGSGCPGITVVATRTSDGATVQTVVTDESGAYLLDSLLYSGGVEYTITPTSQTAQFRYNNTSSGFATVNLSLAHCISTGIDFDNISSVRFSGRVLYENSSIPVRDANFRLNGNLVRLANSPVKTDASGNFELRVPEGSAFTLQVVKEGHHFAGDGFVRINGDSLLTLNGAQDGVRVWDQTKVRLAGRVAGGLDQRNLPLGFGLSTNNLGSNLRFVLELEGDNISHIVRIPSDLTKDTLEFTVPHLVYRNNTVDTVGVTKVHYQLKRIVVEPDPETGEFCVDLFPVRYKLIQATATGYSTLFTDGQTSETINLSDVAPIHDTVYHNSKFTTCNAQYKLTYRSPVSITCKQLYYGLDLDYFGVLNIQRQNIFNEQIQVPVATKLSNGNYHYLFGAPVFPSGNYSFRAIAHEDYYYNNDPNGRHDQVHIKGGTLKVYNGMHDAPTTQVLTKELDSLGQAVFTIPIDYVSFVNNTESVKRVLDLSVEHENEYTEYQALQAYVTGRRFTDNDIMASTHGRIQLLEVLRDPPGSSSSAYLESGAEYTYSYNTHFQLDLGIELEFGYGSQVSAVMGAFEGVGAGLFSGINMNFDNYFSTTIPIKTSYHGKHDASYTFMTTERITTDNSPINMGQSADDPFSVGQNSDVYLGVVQNVLFRHVNAVQPLDSVTYASLQALDANGTMSTIAEGIDTAGKRYYLVIGHEIGMGTQLKSSFTYTHNHIKKTIIPQLIQYRDALLLTCDSVTAQGIADAQNKVVYWSRVTPDDTNWAADGYYVPLRPGGGAFYSLNNEVDSANRCIYDWIELLWHNERDKALCYYYHGLTDTISTYSISGGTSLSHTETYTAKNATSFYWDYPNGVSFSTIDLTQFGRSTKALMQSVFKKISNLSNSNGSSNPETLINNWSGSKFIFNITPLVNPVYEYDPTESTTTTRTIGYTLGTDPLGYMTVTVLRLEDYSNFSNGGVDNFNFNEQIAQVIEDAHADNPQLYGSPIYFLQGGASKCPYEEAYSTEVYKPATPLSGGTVKLENPKLDIDVHERSNVPADQAAIFTLHLYNEIEATTGMAFTVPIQFTLRIDDQSNPHGAQIFIDGMPLTDGRSITLTGNQILTKTMEVRAGVGYDFEDLAVELVSSCMAINKSRAQFSVHYMPVSCDVNLTLPRDNWVLNTLSPFDEEGYYLPVSISDFNVNYRGFDHIELQYKLSTQSDDEWVNLCSYYADSALYAAASGTKAMIEGGRIENIRFYGERDPIEQRYDLRAVSFCRHGSGFISKASPVKSGIKDTRRPRVFGDPEPANGILGVGDHLKLRFNEPIAGNYLDEDNNFQLLGVTNRSGIASSTSVYFDGTPSCEASSEVTRVLSGKSFSIDLMAKPVSPTLTGEQELFGHPASSGGIGFGLEPASTGLRLYGHIDDYRVHSLPLEPLTDFTRLIMAYDHETGLIRFYAGTQDVTEPTTDTTGVSYYDGTAPLVFGRGYQGNMLEARLWFKALTTDEVVETHEKRLTGYERKLAAYYPMNEGRGDLCHDKASGSTLSLQGTTWTTPSGYSLQMNGQQSVTLAQEVLSRSDIQDYTLMFWFRTNESDQGLFSAGWISDTLGTVGSKGTLIKMVNGHLVFQNGNNIVQQSALAYADGLWHHYVLAVNRTYNHASIYVDGHMTNIFDADSLSGLSGVMMLGGTLYGQTPIFNGHFDDLALFEQALPKNLIEAYDNLTPVGDEMGLIALLPFSKERENSNGIMEEVFNVNNQRIFTQTDGTVVNKIQPLIISPDSLTLVSMGDPSDHAPVRERDMLKKMHFDWSFNNDELLININNQDREINKNNIYITVRDVEDLNGNRTVNPSMWQVFVNKNVLLWNSEGINEIFYEQADHEREIPVQIMNVSGQRHQYTIDGMPDWLNVSQAYGNLNPQETQTLVFSVDDDLAVGVYSEIIYLTDENDLSEPLRVLIEVKATCPWVDVNSHSFNHQMSLLGQVMVDGVIDTDPNDVVVAISNGKYVGYQHISSDENYPGYLFMTIYGDSSRISEPLKFRLWQASTGRIFGLSTSQTVMFESNTMVGLPPADPIILYTSANEVQNLNLEQGWNWISFNIAPNDNGALDGLFFTTVPFNQGDQLKSVATQQFAEWDGEHWTGSLSNADYHEMYMMYCGNYHWSSRVAGRRLTSNYERTISLHQGWNSFPYLLTATSGITNAMGDYIDHAQVGDILKSQTQFAVFNAEGHWMGSLTALVPGKGYLLYRNGTETVPFTFHNSKKGKPIKVEESVMKREMKLPATNMTIIATIDNEELSMRAKAGGLLKAYAGTTLAGVAEWQETDDQLLFFLTVGTDLPGQLNFFLEENGTKTELFANIPMKAVANRHFGSLDQPVVLTPDAPVSTPQFQAYPTVFTDHVNFVVSDLATDDMRIVIRNAAGVTVDEINKLNWTNCGNLSAGVYFATLYTKDYTATVKLVKVYR